MVLEQKLPTYVRGALAGAGTLREVKMFGGIGFMLNGNLIAGASRRGLLARVGKQRKAVALARRGARPMVMRGRTMEDYIYVDPPALNERAVKAWLQLAVDFVQTLPRKSPRTTRKRKAPQTRANRARARSG
jgi:TfoX/Sxy family transcriptional regulator of competence genes